MISAAVDISLSKLAGSDNKYNREEKKNPTQASSTNANNKLHLINTSEDEGSHQSLRNISPPYHLRIEKKYTVIWNHLNMGKRLSKQPLEHNYIKFDVKCDG